MQRDDMKGVKAKKVCCYCNKIIVRKPIPVGDNRYAHADCRKKEKLRFAFLFGGKP